MATKTKAPEKAIPAVDEKPAWELRHSRAYGSQWSATKLELTVERPTLILSPDERTKPFVPETQIGCVKPLYDATPEAKAISEAMSKLNETREIIFNLQATIALPIDPVDAKAYSELDSATLELEHQKKFEGHLFNKIKELHAAATRAFNSILESQALNARVRLIAEQQEAKDLLIRAAQEAFDKIVLASARLASVDHHRPELVPTMPLALQLISKTEQKPSWFNSNVSWGTVQENVTATPTPDMPKKQEVETVDSPKRPEFIANPNHLSYDHIAN